MPEDFSLALLPLGILPPLQVSQLVEALEAVDLDFGGASIALGHLLERLGCQSRLEVALGHLFLHFLDLIVECAHFFL